MGKGFKTEYVLSTISFVLLIAGYVAFWIDSEYTISEVFLHTELALFLVVPLFFITLPFAIRGSLKARLIWLGLLSLPIFKIYEKTLNIEGLNSLFFVASFSFALYAIILEIYNLDLKEVRLKLPLGCSKIIITALLIFGILILTGTHFSIEYYLISIRSIKLDDLREFGSISFPNLSIHFFIFRRRIIFGALLPLFILCILSVIRRKTIGVVLTPIVLTSGIVLFTSLIYFSDTLHYFNNFSDKMLSIFEFYYHPIFLIGFIIFTAILLYLLLSSVFLVYYLISIKELKS